MMEKQRVATKQEGVALPCVDTLPVVRGLAPYKDSERCAGKVQPRRRGQGRLGRRKSAQRFSSIGNFA